MAMEEKITYFDDGGKQHTDAALKIAKEYADKNNIGSIVVASTTGFTAKKAAEAFKGKNLVVVTHVHGFREQNKIEFPEETREQLEAKGVKVLTTTHGMGGVNWLVERSIGGIIADTLRMFSQGVKVAVEIAASAADAGLVRTDEDIVAVAGTGKGADTVLVIRPENSHRLFDMKVRKVLAMPI
jgi:hypothetical protein